MSREQALVKNTVILALGTYLPKLTTIVTLPILTGYLTMAEYGTYDLIVTLVLLLLPAVTLQIQSAAFRFLISHRDSKQMITEVVTNIFAFAIPASVLGLIITYVCLGNSLGKDTKLAILAYLLMDILYVGCGQITRGLGKNAVYASGAVVVSVINMLAVCLSLLAFSLGLNGVIGGMAISYAIGSFLLIVRVKIYRYWKWSAISWRKTKELLNYSWPMVPDALSNWVLSLSDRLVILQFLGVESNAIYAAANKLPNLVKTFQGAFVSAWQENAALSVEDQDAEDYYSKMMESVNGVIFGLTAGLIAFTPLLFSILIKGNYNDAYQQMLFLYIGMYFAGMASFLGGIYIAHMKTKSVGLTTLAAAGCNLIIHLATVKVIGLYAASISTLVSYALLFAFRLMDVKKFQKIRVNYGSFLVYLLVLCAMCAMAFARNIALNYLNLLLGVTSAVYVNRALVCIILKKLGILRKYGKQEDENDERNEGMD